MKDTFVKYVRRNDLIRGYISEICRIFFLKCVELPDKEKNENGDMLFKNSRGNYFSV